MVAGFRRSHSLSGSAKPCARPFHRPFSIKYNHIRSASVSFGSHPTLAHLNDEIQTLRSLPASFVSERSAAKWFSDGLDRIDRVLSALGDLLHLPQSQDTPLRDQPAAGVWADRLLDEALCLVDAYGSLLSAAAALKHHVAEARAAIRRAEAARLSSAIRSHRRTDKVLARLAVAIKNLTKSSQPFNLDVMADAGEIDIAGIIKEVMAVTATASAAIFIGIVALSSSTAAAVASTSKDSRRFWSLKRRTSPRSSKKMMTIEEEEAEIVAFETMEGLEECIERVEEGSERVFKSLINTRVALLSSLSASF